MYTDMLGRFRTHEKKKDLCSNNLLIFVDEKNCYVQKPTIKSELKKGAVKKAGKSNSGIKRLIKIRNNKKWRALFVARVCTEKIE